MHSTDNNKPSQWHSVIAGVVAGLVTRSTTSPLDVLKIRLQTKQTNSTLSCVTRHLVQTHGLRGFWKGNLAGCCRLGPYSGVKFYLVDQMQAGDASEDASPTALDHAVSGAVAGVVATLAVYPMELIRTHLVVSHQTSSSISQECLRIFQTSGFKGFYRGCVTGLMGAIPFEGVQFACFEYGKQYAMEHRETALNTSDHLVLGSISGVVAQMVSYPFDTVKRRLQLQAKGVAEYNGMAHCWTTIVREDGVRGLYRGAGVNMLRIVPYGAVMFASYEAVKEMLASELVLA
ncbi:Hydrogenosomal carrier protein [Aphanomyces cochlioides]|nr:Hydrogenosomal carrier protein [Aphanomyces cochlioides]